MPVTKSDARLREEHGDAGEVVRVAPAAGRRAREHALVQARDLLARPAREVGVDPARQDGVDLDVVLRPGAWPCACVICTMPPLLAA